MKLVAQTIRVRHVSSDTKCTLRREYVNAITFYCNKSNSDFPLGIYVYLSIDLISSSSC